MRHRYNTVEAFKREWETSHEEAEDQVHIKKTLEYNKRIIFFGQYEFPDILIK